MQKGVKIFSLSVLLILGFLISTNFISAYTTNYTCNIVLAQNCNASVNGNIILGLSAQSNAHAENYSAFGYSATNPDPAYPYVVCCYFGSGNQTCSGASSTVTGYPTNPPLPQNEIVSLTSNTNAHAEDPYSSKISPYAVPICYWYNNNAPLECISTNLGANPSGCSGVSVNGFNYPINILNLSSTTNAHIGTGPGFDQEICCRIVGTVPGQLSCKLTSVTWTYGSTMQGVQAGLNVTGNNCAGATVTFNITDNDGSRVNNNPSDITFPLSSVSSSSVTSWWTSEFRTGKPNNYKFTALAIFNGNWTTSGTGAGTNATVSVSQQPAGYCTAINTCADYNSSTTCASDSSLCSVAQNDPNKDPLASSYGCSWNATTSVCTFTNIYNGGGSGNGNCGTGFTECTNQSNSLSYCYPGNTCPSGEVPLSNGNGICDIGEGCSSIDCHDGNLDNCKLSTCSAGMCYNATSSPVNITACSNGYTLCYNSLKKLTYCYPSSVCPSGDTFTNNSCANISIAEGSNGAPSSCLGDAVCHHVGSGGYCSSPTAATGKCVYVFNGASGGCTNGFMTYTWTATWTGTGNKPAYCQSGQSVIECPAQIPLPLFTPLNAAIAVALIVGIYLGIHFFRNSKKKASAKRKRTSKKEGPKNKTKKKK